MAALLAAMQQGAAAGHAGAAAGARQAEGGATEAVDMAAPMDDLLFFADKQGDTTVFGRCVAGSGGCAVLRRRLEGAAFACSWQAACRRVAPAAARHGIPRILPLAAADTWGLCVLPSNECRDWQMGSEEEDEEEGDEGAGAAGLHLQDLPGNDEQGGDRRRSVSLGSE